MTGFKQFFQTVRFPIVFKFDQTAAERIFGESSICMIYFSDDEDEGLENFKEFAKENQNKILFSHSTITTDLGARLSEYIGVTSSDKGAVRILRFEGGNLTKYKVNTTSHETMKADLESFIEMKLKAYFKSDPIPETNNEAVKVVVGDSFDDMVLNSNKFVLLEAYAPWCGHC